MAQLRPHRTARNDALHVSPWLVCAVLLALSFSSTSARASADIVISQVYGGGGNGGAIYRNDYVELFNRGASTISIAGWTLQYASASGSGNFAANSPVALNGVLAPGQHYLIQLHSAGAVGASLPVSADTLATAPNAASASGKFALVNNASGLACNGGSTPCTTAQLAQIVDLIGYGAANFFETAAAPGLSVSTIAQRQQLGCADSDNNAADFISATPGLAGTPLPRNLASVATACGATTVVAVNASDASASETGADSGTFTVSRTGADISAPLTVAYMLTGSATAGADYLPVLSGEIIIPANSASVPVLVTPVDDGDIEGNETVLFTLVAGNTYVLGNPDNASVTIADNDSPDTAPVVISTAPASGASGVPNNTRVQVDFSEAVNVAAGAVALQCPLGTTIVSNALPLPNVLRVTLAPPTALAPGASCVVKISAIGIADVDSNDPPDLLAADVNANFTVAASACSASATPIGQIQGTGSSFALSGVRTVRGVVVGDYEYSGSGPTGNALRGFYLQNLPGDADGDTNTSDGLFIFNGTANSVALGQLVQVTGSVSDYGFTNGSGETQTQVTASAVEICAASASIVPTVVNLPVAAGATPTLERYEGMLVSMPQSLHVTEHFQLGRFGQVSLSANGRRPTPTAVAAPGAAAQAQAAANKLNLIVLDDDNEIQNPDPIVFARGGAPLSASNTLRGGDTITALVGVMTQTDATTASFVPASSDPVRYRVRPLAALGGVLPHFQAVNPRPTLPLMQAGAVRIAAFNLLNYFNTFGLGACSNGTGGSAADCRGAESAAEFARQWPKTVAAALNTGADVLVLTELENDGYGAASAAQDLLDKLNAATAPGTFAFINADARTGVNNVLGSDAIRVAMFYRPAKVTPVGTTSVLNSGAFGIYTTANGAIQRNRPALIQAFEDNLSGGRVVVVGNHLKSKGSACDDNLSPVPSDPDTGDGQGNCNLTRTAATQQLATWLATNPTVTGDSDVLITGDLNAYRKEDPITSLEAGGYVDLVAASNGPLAYSYVFDGQWGYLDYALASASLVGQVTAVSELHINVDEPTALDYNTNFKSAGQQLSLYAADALRASDHDPVVALNLTVDSDNDGLANNLEITLGTNPLDADSDDDGMSDGSEDANHNGVVDSSETDPRNADSDGDGLLDGTELGVTVGVADPDGNGPLLGTDAQHFIADADPAQTSLPLVADSDADGFADGIEDFNHNGRLDAGESDPVNASSVPPVSAIVPSLPPAALLFAMVLIASLGLRPLVLSRNDRR